MVEQLTERGVIRDERVAATLLRVPRHQAVPASRRDHAYDPDRAVVWDRGADGAPLTSVSAPDMQVRQLVQADVQLGMHVLEIGSGGVNAAYLADLVGPRGRVTSIDIDPRACVRARGFLDAIGCDLVEVVEADAEWGWAANAPYDRIVSTVETPTIPAAWFDQLTPNGRLVAPLRIIGATRSAGLSRSGDALVGNDLVWCGFVPMQGAGQWQQPRLDLPLSDGWTFRVLAEGDEQLIGLDRDALTACIRSSGTEPDEAWSVVALRPGQTLEWVQLWLLSRLDATMTAMVNGPGQISQELPRHPGMPVPTLFDQGSLAHLGLRVEPDGGYRLGAHGMGPAGRSLARTLVAEIDAWASDPDRRPTLRAERGVPAAGRADITRRGTRFSLIW